MYLPERLGHLIHLEAKSAVAVKHIMFKLSSKAFKLLLPTRNSIPFEETPVVEPYSYNEIYILFIV